MDSLMQALPEESSPITGLYIVSDASRAPLSYSIIDRTLDNDDADLWKDKGFLWGKRTLRYICVCRALFNDNGEPRDVLTEMALINEREEVPKDFRVEEYTIDTKEKCLQKRQLCVKFTPAASTYTAITDVIVLSGRTRRPPVGYTLVGEVNSLLLCYKTGKIPAAMQKSAKTRSSSIREPEQQQQPENQRPVYNRSNTRHTHPLSGVPFEINKKYCNEKTFDFYQPKIIYKSHADIDNEYTFDFSIEAGEL